MAAREAEDWKCECGRWHRWRTVWCPTKRGGCGRVAPKRTFRRTLERKVLEHQNEATLRRFGLLNSQDQSRVEEHRPPE